MRFAGRTASAMVLSASLTLTPAGCMTETLSGGTSLTFCDGAKPIFWSSKDTDGTLRQIKGHNAVGVDACGWGGSAPGGK